MNLDQEKLKKIAGAMFLIIAFVAFMIVMLFMVFADAERMKTFSEPELRFLVIDPYQRVIKIYNSSF